MIVKLKYLLISIDKLIINNLQSLKEDRNAVSQLLSSYWPFNVSTRILHTLFYCLSILIHPNLDGYLARIPFSVIIQISSTCHELLILKQKMFVIIPIIHGIKVADILLQISNILQHHPKTHTNKSSKSVFKNYFRFLQNETFCNFSFDCNGCNCHGKMHWQICSCRDRGW